MNTSRPLSLTLPSIFLATLIFSHTPDAQATESVNALTCNQLRAQLSALNDKMIRSPNSGGVNNSVSVGEVIWSGLVGQQLKKSNGSVSHRANQLKRAYSQKCSS